MTERNPAYVISAASHDAEGFRRMIHLLTGGDEGIYNPGDLEVTEKSGTPDMSVDVAGGRALILGDEGTFQGTYFAENEGNTNLTVTAADATNDRIDLVVAQVEDAEYSGAVNAWSLAMVDGTPAGSPSAPATPDNAIVLAEVTVPANATEITNSDISDQRELVGIAGFAGEMKPFAGSTAPNGWLLCDGSAVSRTTFARLFAAIGTDFGNGDGSTTFNLPDLQGRVPVGQDSGTFSTIGATGGEEAHTLTESELPAHDHQIWAGDLTGGAGGGGVQEGQQADGALTSDPIADAGGGGAHNNLQPYQVIGGWIIST